MKKINILKSQTDFSKRIQGDMEKSATTALLEALDYTYNSFKALVAEKPYTHNETLTLVKDLGDVINYLVESENVQLREQSKESEGGSASNDSSQETEQDTNGTVSRTGESGSGDTGKSADGILVFKQADGKWRWLGTPSSNYTDRHADILTKESHLDFVDAIKSNQWEYPELRFYHIPVAIGKADYADYDEKSGMLVASGYFYDEYSDIAEGLSKSNEIWGMSHGMPRNEIRRNAQIKNYIERYRSKEFTFLKAKDAAGPLGIFYV